MGISCSRRQNFRVQIIITTEAEPQPEPAPEREDAASAAEDASDDWETVSEPRPPPIGAAPPAPVVRYVSRQSLCDAAFRPVPLQYPVEQRPSLNQLLDNRNRVYIVWFVPGQPEWTGIHYGAGTHCWAQLRSWACAAHPELSPTDAFKRLRWIRSLGSNHNQVEAALRRESEGRAVLHYWYWRR